MAEIVVDQSLADAKNYLLKAAQALKVSGRMDLAENVTQLIGLIETPDSEPIIVQNLHI